MTQLEKFEDLLEEMDLSCEMHERSSGFTCIHTSHSLAKLAVWVFSPEGTLDDTYVAESGYCE